MTFEVGSGASDEEGLGQMQPVEALEIQVSAIHDIVSPGQRNQAIENIDVVQFPVGDQDEIGDGAAQVEQGMQLDRPHAAEEAGQGKHRETEIDDSGIQGIDSGVQLDAEIFLGVETLGMSYQNLSELCIDAPIAGLVGIGKIVAGDSRTDAHVK